MRVKRGLRCQFAPECAAPRPLRRFTAAGSVSRYGPWALGRCGLKGLPIDRFGAGEVDNFYIANALGYDRVVLRVILAALLMCLLSWQSFIVFWCKYKGAKSIVSFHGGTYTRRRNERAEAIFSRRFSYASLTLIG